jgi:propionyl-CoA synthetase
MSYQDVYRASLEDPYGFWSRAAEEICWEHPYEHVWKDDRWFVGARLSTCYNCLDRHVEEGRAEQPAVIYDSPVTGIQQVLNYRQLRDRVALFAGALARLGVQRGDRVLIYMPMTPEALVAMHACSRLGAVHSVVFGGFASQELAVRIDDARPRVVVSASCGIEVTRIVEYKPLLDKALELSNHKPQPRPGVAGSAGRGGAGRLPARGSDRPALYSLHLRNHRQAKRRGARPRRTRRGAEMEHVECLRHRAR